MKKCLSFLTPAILLNSVLPNLFPLNFPFLYIPNKNMIFLLYLFSSVLANLVSFEKTIRGPVMLTFSRSSMFAKESIYGSLSPSISLNCISYLGTSIYEWGYIGILSEAQHQFFQSSSTCQDFQTNSLASAHLANSSLSLSISETGDYYVALILCDDVDITINLLITNINPYGHVPGDLFYMLPVPFT
jgi:hypothetical protein